MNKFDTLQRNRILSHFGTTEVVKSISNELEKGKKANIGEVREWNGEKWKKEVQGWVRLSDGKTSQNMGEKEVSKNDAVDLATKKKGGREGTEGLGLFKGDAHMFASVRNSHTKESLTESVKSVLSAKGLNSAGRVAELFRSGLEVHEIVNVSGTPLSATIDYIKKAKKSGAFNDAGGNSNKSEDKPSPDKKESKNTENVELDVDEIDMPEVSVDDRWNSYQHFGTMIGLKQCRAMFAYGSGGVGKTFTLMDDDAGVFSRLKLRKGDLNPNLDDVDNEAAELQGGDSEESIIGRNPQTGEAFLKKDKYDYITVTGKVTASRMFELLQEHNDKLIVFDDCDSVLQDENSINVLKGALDTSGDGTISWEGKGVIKSKYAGIKGAKAEKDNKGNIKYFKLPSTFKFTGQAVFISNLKVDKVPQAIRSRSLTIDLTMNRQETVDKIDSIKDKVKFKDPQGNIIEVSEENRENAMDFMRKYKNKFDEADLNVRTFIKIALTYETVGQYGTNMSPEKIMVSSLFTKKY